MSELTCMRDHETIKLKQHSADITWGSRAIFVRSLGVQIPVVLDLQPDSAGQHIMYVLLCFIYFLPGFQAF